MKFTVSDHARKGKRFGRLGALGVELGLSSRGNYWLNVAELRFKILMIETNIWITYICSNRSVRNSVCMYLMIGKGQFTQKTMLECKKEYKS